MSSVTAKLAQECYIKSAFEICSSYTVAAAVVVKTVEASFLFPPLLLYYLVFYLFDAKVLVLVPRYK